MSRAGPGLAGGGERSAGGSPRTEPLLLTVLVPRGEAGLGLPGPAWVTVLHPSVGAAPAPGRAAAPVYRQPGPARPSVAAETAALGALGSRRAGRQLRCEKESLWLYQ